MLRRHSNSASILTVSPTFSSYSSTRFTEIASRVVEEVNRENDEEAEMEGNDEDFLFSGAVAHLKQMALDPPKDEEEQEEISLEPSQRETAAMENAGEGDEEDEDEDDDFEFAFVPRDPDAPPLTADEMFADGQIRPIWPIFNRDLIFAESNESDESNKEQNPSPSISLPMRKLLTEDRNPPSQGSDALDRIPAGSYCVWRPKAHRSAKPESSSSPSCSSAAPGGCKKSNSTGSSKVWRFRDLMHRSSSNGQDTMVFLSTDAIKGGEKKGKAAAAAAAPGGKKGEKKREVSAHEIYLRNRMMSEGDRRRSFLPYRQDLVGFFANVNGLSRSLQPF